MSGNACGKWWYLQCVQCQVGSKDMRGARDCLGSLNGTVQPRKTSGHRAVLCLVRGTVESFMYFSWDFSWDLDTMIHG